MGSSVSLSEPVAAQWCPCCPHYDTFHATCGHVLHRDLVHELVDRDGECSLFDAFRAQVMRDLSERLS